MRSLLLLLACFAAANAGNFYYYSGCYYDYRVCLPRTPCLSYKPISVSYKCEATAKYPSDACTKDMTETAVADLVAAYTTFLAGKKTEIETTLNGEKTTAIEEFNGKVDEWVIAARAEVNKHFDEQIEKYEENKDAFNTARTEWLGKIDTTATTLKTNANESYQKSCERALENVGKFHTSLVTRYETCLNMRLTKIGEYETKVDERMGKLLEAFTAKLGEQKTKIMDSFKASLAKVSEDIDATAVIAIYDGIIQGKINTIIGEYTTKLNNNGDELKGAYKCAISCDGCRSYYKCTRPKIDWCAKSIKVPCAQAKKFDYKPRLCKYEPKTCPEVVNKTEAELEAQIDAIIGPAVEAAKAEKAKWVTEQEAANAKAIENYGKCLDEAYAKEITSMTEYLTKTDDELTAEEEQKIADRKTEQASEKTAAIEEFTKKVDERFTKAKELFDTMIGKYETRLNEIKKVYIANYNKCLEQRTTYFVDYEKKLDEQIAKMRAALVAKLDFYVEKNTECYHNYLVAYVGEENRENDAVTTMVAAYKLHLQALDTPKLESFDNHWAEMKPKLLKSAECRVQCTCRTFTPCKFTYKPCIYEPKCVARCYTRVYTPCYYNYTKFYGGYCGCV